MLSIEYQHTRYYFLPTGDGASLLAFDAGYPCSLYRYARELKGIGYGLASVRWAMASHFHLDHAGLIGEFQAAGVQCILFENQGGGIAEMERIIRPKYAGYRPIDASGFMMVSTGESREFLASFGIGGEVLLTPGHSDDSVSLVTDDREAMIGDLYPISQVMDGDEASLRSWDRLRDAGAKYILPSHAPAFEL